ncbi:hypothetical protein [Blastomonas sp.]|uniref:hypothetical protein n=1 Tax=Blastomonas sp. TaxID=1909299 RepID=UPI0026290F8C|nr:hypothetical protein [Blastomonas sp.]MDM7954902.1 hypothetical protein [Blastomonas sp.]
MNALLFDARQAALHVAFIRAGRMQRAHVRNVEIVKKLVDIWHAFALVAAQARAWSMDAASLSVARWLGSSIAR